MVAVVVLYFYESKTSLNSLTLLIGQSSGEAFSHCYFVHVQTFARTGQTQGKRELSK